MLTVNRPFRQNLTINRQSQLDRKVDASSTLRNMLPQPARRDNTRNKRCSTCNATMLHGQVERQLVASLAPGLLSITGSATRYLVVSLFLITRSRSGMTSSRDDFIPQA